MPLYEDDDDSYKSYNVGWTAHPFDARHPHQNQYPHCIQNYVDYFRCKKLKGDDFLNCNYFKKVYRSSCHSWMVCQCYASYTLLRFFSSPEQYAQGSEMG